jgi:hypothetical protein
VNSRISRCGSNPYGHIWIPTLERIYDESLQQIIPKKSFGTNFFGGQLNEKQRGRDQTPLWDR